MKATLDHSVLSSLHGRKRRELRGISKSDLQTAVKYGKKESSHNWRWKYTFGDIVYITDATSRQEITSWVLPSDDLELAPVIDSEIVNHAEIKTILLEDNTKCTAHTVVVIDQSGSMRNCDVSRFKTRSDAVFSALATDYIAASLRSGLTLFLLN